MENYIKAGYSFRPYKNVDSFFNHKMVSSNKGKEIIKTIPEHLLLTETDAPFTFSNGIKTRIESLNSTIIGLGFQKGKSPDEIRDMVYNNFKKILQLQKIADSKLKIMPINITNETLVKGIGKTRLDPNAF